MFTKVLVIMQNYGRAMMVLHGYDRRN